MLTFKLCKQLFSYCIYVLSIHFVLCIIHMCIFNLALTGIALHGLRSQGRQLLYDTGSGSCLTEFIFILSRAGLSIDSLLSPTPIDDFPQRLPSNCFFWCSRLTGRLIFLTFAAKGIDIYIYICIDICM